MKIYSCSLFLVLMLTLSTMFVSSPLHARPGGTDDYSLSADPAYEYIRAKDYTSAFSILQSLQKDYPREPEIPYLLAYLRYRLYQDIKTQNIGEPQPIDMQYVNNFITVLGLDQNYDPGYLSDLDKDFLFFDAGTKLTSYLGVYALYAKVDGDYETEAYYYRLCRESGGYVNEILEYNANMLNSCEENAIVFTNGDMDTLPAIYLQSVKDSLFAGYMHPAREVYPGIKRQALTQKILSERMSREHGFRRDIAVINLSLLNTDWYLEYVRDVLGVQFSPDIELFFSEDYEMPWDIDVNIAQNTKLDFYYDIPEDPPWETDYWYIKSDQAVYQIIRDNYGSRPIYFATTCATFLGLDDHLRTEGLVERLVAKEAEDQTDLQRMIKNADTVYSYRWASLQNFHKALKQNYSSSFIRIALAKVSQGLYAEAEGYISKARLFCQQEWRFSEFYITLYTKQSKWTELDAFIADDLVNNDLGDEIYISYLLLHLLESYPDHFMEYLEKGMLLYPAESKFADIALSYGEEYSNFEAIHDMFHRMDDMLEYDLAPYHQKLNEYWGG